MFDKLKDLKKLKDLESSLGKEILEKERDGVKIVVNGKSEIISISINPELSKERQEQVLKMLSTMFLARCQGVDGQKGRGNNWFWAVNYEISFKHNNHKGVQLEGQNKGSE